MIFATFHNPGASRSSQSFFTLLLNLGCIKFPPQQDFPAFIGRIYMRFVGFSVDDE